jgi:DNA-binding response OmpR family regulator
MPSRSRILIVEDNADLRTMFQIALSLAGFDVREARNGYEALQRVDDDRPDLLVLDIGLPDVDGSVVLKDLMAQRLERPIPVVVVTARREPIEGGNVRCVLRKPVDPYLLVQTVKSCLSQATQARV